MYTILQFSKGIHELFYIILMTWTDFRIIRLGQTCGHFCLVVCLSLSAWHFPTAELLYILYIQIFNYKFFSVDLYSLWTSPVSARTLGKTLRDVANFPALYCFPSHPYLLICNETLSLSTAVRSSTIPGGSTKQKMPTGRAATDKKVTSRHQET